MTYKEILRLVTLFPTQLRALHSQLQSISQVWMTDQPIKPEIRRISMSLASTLHLMSGKVNGPKAWRIELDDAVRRASDLLESLRMSFRSSFLKPGVHLASTASLAQNHASDDPLKELPDRQSQLHNTITYIHELLKSRPSRHVQLPVGKLVQLSLVLLRVHANDNVCLTCLSTE